jgi:8-oxo-dGTP pyrophosphatase MutT (NUDIX family)
LQNSSTFDRLVAVESRSQTGFDGVTTATAATLVVTYDTASGPRLVLTRRPMTLRRHPGQIAFPGGMIEPSDRSPLDAAFRESGEEIGLRVGGDVDIVSMTPVETFVSGIIIQPFWLQLPESPRLRADPTEVEEILRIPIEDLLAPGALRSMTHPRWPDREILAYRWYGSVIWGATARTVSELVDQHPSTRHW